VGGISWKGSECRQRSQPCSVLLSSWCCALGPFLSPHIPSFLTLLCAFSSGTFLVYQRSAAARRPPRACSISSWPTSR